MTKVSNGKCVRRLGLRSMKAARARNIVAVIAIALTTVLFTSLFTIAASINYSYQQANFRMAGGDAHGTIKEISREQVEELRDDPVIQDSWARLFLGMPTDPPFSKSHVEVSYLEPNGASHYFCTPVEGTLPREGTDEAATDTHVLALLGVEPKVGAQFTLSFPIDSETASPQLVTCTFTLSGWWEYDSAVVTNHILLPRSAAEEIAALSSGDSSTMTGKWNLDLMFRNALNIWGNLETVLENHGYQNVDSGADNYIKTGVNWGYTGDRLSSSIDPTTVLAIAAILLLIIFTGYLIIYNVFQISVTNDIRFYGLLKTIGTTGRQLKRIIRQQALLLSLIGIPLGLILGFFIGNKLTPVIMSTLSYQNAFVSFNPWIFIGAAVFSLVTVFLSCARPGRLAAKVSPVEAVRFTEGGGGKAGKKSVRKNVNGASLPRMAWANLGRSRGKTIVTVISLTLAVVLMTLTYTFAAGFDMDKYLQGNVVTDFIVGHSSYFQSDYFSEYETTPEEIIADVEARDGITEGGRVYAKSWDVEQFVTEDRLRQSYARWGDESYVQQAISSREHLPDGRVKADAMLYGMEDFPLSQLTVVEGDLAPLRNPAQNAVAAVCSVDDYGSIIDGSVWARVGDTVTLRQVSEWAYYDTATGEELTQEEIDAQYASGNFLNWGFRAKTYEEKDYTVCALVTVPSALSFRYSILGADSYVLGAGQFIQDTGARNVMLYAFNTTEESNTAMEEFLADYTETAQPVYDYESKQSYTAQFEGFRNMFLTLGGALSLIIGLVGVLNFINAVLTGILTRKREFAVLQSIGMTGRQLKTMLVYEGLYYTLLAVGLSLVLSLLLGPLAGSALSGLLFFFTYRFTAAPLLAVLPVFALLGILVPLAVYRSAARFTIVERLREADS